MTVWSLADVTRELERHENVFQELQHAIGYLDHAPAGFFSAEANGNIVYINATLADWLEHDLAQVGSGGLEVEDIVAGEGAALLTTLAGVPGDVKTEVLDIDLKTRSGRTVPARLFHKVAFGADGAPGASRTLVLNRARDDGSDPQRAAEVRFMRFFQNTPMAIATVSRRGRIADSNARFARLFHPALKGEGERSILAVVAERDRAALEAAIRKAADGQSEIAPVDAALDGPVERFASSRSGSVGYRRRRSAAWRRSTGRPSSEPDAASRLIARNSCWALWLARTRFAWSAFASRLAMARVAPRTALSWRLTAAAWAPTNPSSSAIASRPRHHSR